MGAFALRWSIDGPMGAAFLVLVAAAGVGYVLAAASGSRRDRRRRQWPRSRTLCFLAGLVVLVVDVYSPIGVEADSRLSVHMVEHMVMWVVVAPLLVASAPVRLALFALDRRGRRRLATVLRSRPVSALASPLGSVSLFAAVMLATHIPAVYGLTLQNDSVHEAEHGLYLLSAMLMWAPILGVDPLPHRVGRRGEVACMCACMAVMIAIAVWLGAATGPVYRHYLGSLGSSALQDQRLAATIMWVGCLPAFAIPALRRVTLPRGRPARVAARIPG